MNVEGSRDPERILPTFQMERNLTREQAVNLFNERLKPRTFHLTGYLYLPTSGLFMAKGYDQPDRL